jgi:hypothetical protein
VALVAAALAAVMVWGDALVDDGVGVFLEAPPFVGTWRVLWTPALWWAVALGAAIVAVWVPATESVRWPVALGGSWLLGLVWPALLQLSEGWESLYTVLGNRRAYLPTARSIDSPAEFLSTFVDRLADYPTHVKGHPPGATLLHWAVDGLGGGRPEVLTATFLAVAALAAPASLIALDRVAGRAAARRAAPFAGLAPAAMWIASSPDAVFMGVMAVAVALGAVAVTGAGRGSDVASLTAGLLAGVSVSFSYGAVLLLGPLWALAVLGVRRGRWRALVPAAAGAAVVPVLFALAGFDWFDGLAGTHEAYLAGVAPERPDRYFVVSNLVVLAVAVGPATVASLTWLRDRAAWWLVGGALAGALAADLSSMSKGEVERIWLPVVPFLLLATTAIDSRRARRFWLAAQLAVGLALQSRLDAPW